MIHNFNIMEPTRKHDTIFSSDSEESQVTPQYVSLSVTLNGEVKETDNYNLLVIFDGQIVVDENWQDRLTIHTPRLPLNLNDPQSASLAADNPIILLLRSAIIAKTSKELSAYSKELLLNPENKVGATIDLIPLILGDQNISKNVSLVDIISGQRTGFDIDVRAFVNGTGSNTKIPLTITVVSAHCLPIVKDDINYICAIGFDGLVDPVSVNFGMSHNPQIINEPKIFWASASGLGCAGRSENVLVEDDIFVPEGLELSAKNECASVTWNAMKRILVDAKELRERLKTSFFIELAGIAKTGKSESKYRYLGFIDARVLLEPGQFGVTTSAKLSLFNEEVVPESVGVLLDISTTSTKPKSPLGSKTKTPGTNLSKNVTDTNDPYIVVKFDITEPLVPAVKTTALHDIINVPVPEVITKLQEELYVKPPPDDNTIDSRRIRKECGALAVHKELSSLAFRGQVPMNQGIKRTAANRLMMRVRGMLKQFPPDGASSSVDWQDTVTAQHSASRRAVTASFEPQPPYPRLSSRYATAHMAGNKQLSEKLLKMDFEVAKNHPKSLLTKALRFLELREDSEGRSYLVKALNVQPRNRFVLWAYGSQEFNKGKEQLQKAVATLRIAATGDYSDGCANTIGWAALHAVTHYDGNVYYAFVAAKRMRKYFLLPIYWKDFLKRWEHAIGYQELSWLPSSVAVDDPFLIAAAFFLCLRAYALSELLLRCFEQGCSNRGSRLPREIKSGPDVYYLRAASQLLRRNYDKALNVIEAGIKKMGPCAILSQLRTACLLGAKGWDEQSEGALLEADTLGSEWSQALLLQAAVGGMLTDPETALQRAARAHKIEPSAYSALAIGRIYGKLKNEDLAERWTAAAVKLEPLLADGWAFLALMALDKKNIDKARALIRTAKQAGEISEDILDEVNYQMNIAHAWGLPETLMKNVCFCEYH